MQGEFRRRQGPHVFDEIAQMGIVVVPDGRFHGDGFLGDFQDLAHLVFRHVHFLRQSRWVGPGPGFLRSEEHTSELQSLMRRSYAVFWLKKKKTTSHT